MGLESYARLVPFAFCSIADILAISGVHFFINSPYRSIKKKSKTLSSSLELDKKKKSTSSQKNLSNWQILKYVPILALVYLSFAGNLEISYIEPILPNYWMKLTDNNWNTLKSGILFGFSPLSYTIFMPILGKFKIYFKYQYQYQYEYIYIYILSKLKKKKKYKKKLIF